MTAKQECQGHMCLHCGKPAEFWSRAKDPFALKRYWCSHTCKLKVDEPKGYARESR